MRLDAAALTRAAVGAAAEQSTAMAQKLVQVGTQQKLQGHAQAVYASVLDAFA